MRGMRLLKKGATEMVYEHEPDGLDGAGLEGKKKTIFHSGYFYMIEPSWPPYLKYKYGRLAEPVLCQLYDCLGSMANFRMMEINGRFQRSRVKAEDGKKLWTSLRIIGLKTGKSPNTVRKYLLMLQEAGLITAEIIPGEGIKIGFTCPIPAPPGDYRKKKRRSKKKEELLGEIAVLQAKYNISNDYIQSYIEETFRRHVELNNMGIPGLQKVRNWIMDCSPDGCTQPRSTVDGECNPFEVRTNLYK